MSTPKRIRKKLITIYILIALASLTVLFLVFWKTKSYSIPNPSPTTILFQDDFTKYSPSEHVDKNTTPWVYSPREKDTASHWFFTSGHLYHEPTSPADYTEDPRGFLDSIVTIRQKPLDNYMLRFRTEPLDGEGFGVIFRFKDINNYYRIYTVKNKLSGGPYVRFEKRANGKIQTLANVNSGSDFYGDYDIGKWYNLRLVVRDNTFEFFVNGSSILKTVDYTFKSGLVGLSSWKQSADFFDDVLITKIN